MAILRNEDGFSPLAASHPLADLDMSNILKWSRRMEDFLDYDITQLIGGNPYTLTATNCVDTISGANGVLLLTLGGADNDGGELQGIEAPWQLVAGKRLYMQARFKIALAGGGTIAANEFFMGLAKIQTTTSFMNAGGTALAVDNALGFVKYDASGTIGSVMRTVDVESTDGGLITPTDGGWITAAIYYTGAQAKFYAGSAADGSDMKLVSTLTGNDPLSLALTPTIWFKGGEAKANVLHTDYILISSER